MDDSGWKIIKPQNLRFLIRRTYSETEFKILLSDFVRLWSVESTASDLQSMCRRMNPLCEFEESKIIKNVFDLFDNNLHLVKVGEVENAQRTLEMFADLGHLSFSLSWDLSVQSPDVLFKEVMLPLLQTAQDLIHCQEELCHLLKEKDKEIAEYISENGRLKWGRVKTEPFIEDEFKARRFTDPCDNNADPIEFSSNSDLFNIVNMKINNNRNSAKTCQNSVKIERLEQSGTSVESELHDVVKMEVLESQLDNFSDMKPENLETKEEVTSLVPSEVKSKRRKKVKLNL